MAASMARVIFSPTTTPMLPPMNDIHRGHDDVPSADLPGGRDDRVEHAGRGDGRLEALLIRLGVGEPQGVGGAKAGIVFRPGAVESERSRSAAVSLK